MQILREACGVPLGLPAKKWMLEIGAVFMRTETELILKSRRVVPARLLKHGFTFKYPYWRDAALDLCRQLHGRPRLVLHNHVVERQSLGIGRTQPARTQWPPSAATGASIVRERFFRRRSVAGASESAAPAHLGTRREATRTKLGTPCPRPSPSRRIGARPVRP